MDQKDKNGMAESWSRAKWNRHTLLWLTPEGRRYAASHIRIQPWETAAEADDSRRKKLILDLRIPGILCRQPEQYGVGSSLLTREIWTCGFSGWEYSGGRRLRVLADIRACDVTRCETPFELCSGGKRTAFLRKFPELAGVFDAAELCGIEAGVYGSTALEWVTGLPYRHRNSDYDLYICPESFKAGEYTRFGDVLESIERTMNIRIDVELEAGGYGVKFREFLRPGITVLGKGLLDTRLLYKSDL